MKKNSEDVEQRLRHKPVILEGFQTAQRSKKPKRKEMSAREKRIRGIYKISPKGQRLGFSLIYVCCGLAWFSDGQRALFSFYLIQSNPALLLTPHYYVEDITWPRGDMNFIFECWTYLSRMSGANKWEILSAREDKIRIPKRPCNVLFIL